MSNGAYVSVSLSFFADDVDEGEQIARDIHSGDFNPLEDKGFAVDRVVIDGVESEGWNR